MKKAIIILLILFILIFSYCAILFFNGAFQSRESKIPHISLNEKEKELEKTINIEYPNYTTRFAHDDYMIDQNGYEGDFRVNCESKTNKEPCGRDSLFLDSLSSKIAYRIYSVLSHKNNYNKISVLFYTISATAEERHSYNCSNSYNILIKDIIKKN